MRRLQRSGERGFTLIELLIVLVVIGILAAISIVAYLNTLKKAHVSYFAAESRAIYNALVQYYQDNERYPTDVDLSTLEPLRPVYYDGDTRDRLLGGTYDDYGGPGNGTDSGDEFWLEFTLEIDPSLRMLIASTDESGWGGGGADGWMEGIFLFRDGQIRPLPW